MKKLSKEQIASNYARALYETAEQSKKLDQVRSDVVALQKYLKDLSLLKRMDNPLIDVSSKQNIIKDISKALLLSDVTANFLEILSLQKRMQNIEGILSHFLKTDYQNRKIIEVVIKTAQPLTDTQEKRLVSGLEKKLGQKVLPNIEIDPNILGGLVLHYNSFEIDDSILGKLKTLEQVMKGIK